MSDKFPRVRCEQLVQVLKKAGFVEKRQKGSHLTMWRDSDKRRVTVQFMREEKYQSAHYEAFYATRIFQQTMFALSSISKH